MNFIKLPQKAALVIDILEKSGFEAYAVGGCVRDSILQKIPNDWDIATNAKPNDVTSVFRKKGFGVAPTGIKHGTVTVIVDKQHFEVTTFRADGHYTDGRHPEEVFFASNLTDDLERRDFTINAMAYSQKSGLIDVFGGLEDLQRKIVRCVGNASARFSEDYLRMLRAYRFAAVLNFKLDDDIISHVLQNKSKIKGVSAERIREEMDKTLTHGTPSGIADFLKIFLPEIIPELLQPPSAIQFANNSLLISLCAILAPVPKSAKNILSRLKYDNKTIQTVTEVLQNSTQPPCADKPSIKRLLNKIGVPSFNILCAFQQSSYESEGKDLSIFPLISSTLHEITANREPFAIADLAITGNDLMSTLGLPPGKKIGSILNALLDKVTDVPSLNEKTTLLQIAKTLT